jgi:hypothetical protein
MSDGCKYVLAVIDLTVTDLSRFLKELSCGLHSNTSKYVLRETFIFFRKVNLNSQQFALLYE